MKPYRDIYRLFRRGEMSTLCKAALPKHGPLDTPKLAQHVMDAKGFAPDHG